jgi:TPR repeat protein
MYAFGKGVLKDYKQAVYWYQKAADQGYAKAQSNLAKNRLGFCISLIGCFLIPIHGLFIIF